MLRLNDDPRKDWLTGGHQPPRDTFTSPFSFSAFLLPVKKAAQDFCYHRNGVERSGGDKIRNRCFFHTAFWLLLPGFGHHEDLAISSEKIMAQAPPCF